MYSPHKPAHYLLGISIYNWNWCNIYNPFLQSICVENGLKSTDILTFDDLHLINNTEEIMAS